MIPIVLCFALFAVCAADSLLFIMPIDGGDLQKVEVDFYKTGGVDSTEGYTFGFKGPSTQTQFSFTGEEAFAIEYAAAGHSGSNMVLKKTPASLFDPNFKFFDWCQCVKITVGARINPSKPGEVEVFVIDASRTYTKKITDAQSWKDTTTFIVKTEALIMARMFDNEDAAPALLNGIFGTKASHSRGNGPIQMIDANWYNAESDLPIWSQPTRPDFPIPIADVGVVYPVNFEIYACFFNFGDAVNYFDGTLLFMANFPFDELSYNFPLFMHISNNNYDVGYRNASQQSLFAKEGTVNIGNYFCIAIKCSIDSPSNTHADLKVDLMTHDGKRLTTSGMTKYDKRNPFACCLIYSGPEEMDYVGMLYTERPKADSDLFNNWRQFGNIHFFKDKVTFMELRLEKFYTLLNP